MTETKYKTEKRKASEGERILITNDEYSFGYYENGDVVIVSSVFAKGVKGEGDGWFILHNEYEVIVGEHTPAPNLDEMDNKDYFFNKSLELERMSKEDWVDMIAEIRENGRRLEENEKRLLLERVENDHLRRNALSLIFGELRDGGITARERRVYRIAKKANK